MSKTPSGLAAAYAAMTTIQIPNHWSAEQALSSGTCAAVLLWPKTLDDQASRRLQLAAAIAILTLIATGVLLARWTPWI